LADHPAHPALVVVPIGAWIASLAFDVASRVVAEPAFLTEGSRWLIAIGVLGALAAAVPGFFDLLGIPQGSPALRTAILHMSLNLTATAGYAVGFFLRGDNTGATAGPVQTLPLLLSVASLLVVSAGGYLGGELVFRFGVRVRDVRDGRVTGTPTPPHSKEQA
jgi:uncharacterized membrane protein